MAQSAQRPYAYGYIYFEVPGMRFKPLGYGSGTVGNLAPLLSMRHRGKASVTPGVASRYALSSRRTRSVCASALRHKCMQARAKQACVVKLCFLFLLLFCGATQTHQLTRHRFLCTARAYLLVRFDVRGAVVGHVRHTNNVHVEPALRQRLQYLADLLVLACGARLRENITRRNVTMAWIAAIQIVLDTDTVKVGGAP